MESALHEQGGQARYLGASKNLSVWDTVAPLDTQNASQAARVECAESVSLPGVGGSRLTAGQECGNMGLYVHRNH